MEVRFRRMGARRYAVAVYREGLPLVEMNPAPGYDPLVPHDLLHLAVESELRLRRGIFGQLASGGHAGTFHPVATAAQSRREAARRRRRAAARGGKLLREGRRESTQSERATYLCLYEWLARSPDRARRDRAAGMAAQAERIRALQTPDERRALGGDVASRVCARLDDLSARWRDLEIGGSFTVAWH